MPFPPATALTLPPQVLATGGESGFALVSPLGYVSENARPESVSLALGLVMVKVRSEVPFARIGSVPNAFAMKGGTMAASEAVAEPVPPAFVPLSVVETKPLTLACGPAVVAVTLTLTVHDPFGGRLAPVVCPKLNVVAPGVGAHVGEPEHVVLADGDPATCSPPGSVSVNFAPVSCTLLGLVSVSVSVDVALTAIGFGEKDLVSVGWAGVPQPVMAMLSRYRSASAPLLPAL